jgi:transposase
MWEPFRKSIEQWAPQCQIVYDKFHIMQHANDAVDEVRRAEFFRKSKELRELIKGKRWLLLSRWENLSDSKRGQLNELFGLNRRVFKSLPAERESGPALGLPVSRSHAQLFE